MSIRVKTLLWVCLVIVFVGVVNVVGFGRVLLDSYTKIENEWAKTNVGRVVEAYQTELENLNTKLIDWSAWDDTYQFILDRNERYIQTNLKEATLTNLKINEVAFLDSDGAVVYEIAYDFEGAAPVEFPQLRNYFASDSGMFHFTKKDESTTGVITLPQGYLMFVARPVINTDETAPVRGTMVFGRLLSAQEVERLARITKLDVTLLTPEDLSAADGGQTVTALTGETSSVLVPVSQTKLYGFSLIRDMFGNPAFVFRVEMPRTIFMQGKTTLQTIAVAGLVSSIMFLLGISIIIERGILRKILNYSSEVGRISQKNDLSQRMKLGGGGDEVGRLGVDINNMLDSIEGSQKQLHEVQRQSQAYLDIVAVMIVALNPDGVINLINKKACDVLGVAEKDALGKNWFDLYIPEKDREKVRNIFATNMKSPREKLIEEFENAVRTYDGSEHIIKWHNTVLRDASGKPVVSLSSGEDITDRRLSEQDMAKRNEELESTKEAMLNLLEDARDLEALLKKEKEGVEQTVLVRTKELRQEQARLTASINSLAAGFILTDPNGRIITKNPAVVSILNIHNTAVEHLHDIDNITKDAIQLKLHHEKAQQEKKPITVSNIIFGAKFLRLFVAPIYLAEVGGDFLGTVVLIQDQTEEKILERSKDEFFSIASHELRTPLTAIRGNTSMIMEYFATELKDEQLKEMISDVHESSIRLISIVNDFLDVSRLEQGRMQFHSEVFNMGGLIADVLKEYQVTGSRSNLYLRYEPPEKPLPQAYADKTRVKQVLINLVGNALKFTEQGGVTVRIHLYDGFIRVVVEDSGRGIPYENQMLLFRKFQQAGDSLFTRDATKGTGLGLYISKLMVEGMGGSIGLQYSQPGKGSAFGFAVPIATDQNIAEVKPEAKPEATS